MRVVRLDNVREKRTLIHRPVPIGKDLHLVEPVEAGCLNPSPDAADGDAALAHEPAVCEKILGGHLPVADVEGEEPVQSPAAPDLRLEAEIGRCGRLNRLFAFHVCDWKVPTEDFLTDRGLMGEGCVPIRRIRGWVEAAGFDGFNEVEIFSDRYWAMDQGAFLSDIIEAYDTHV